MADNKQIISQLKFYRPGPVPRLTSSARQDPGQQGQADEDSLLRQGGPHLHQYGKGHNCRLHHECPPGLESRSRSEPGVLAPWSRSRLKKNKEPVKISRLLSPARR